MIKNLFCVTMRSGQKKYIALESKNYNLAAQVCSGHKDIVKSVELITDTLIAGPEHLMLPPNANDKKHPSVFNPSAPSTPTPPSTAYI